MTTRAELRVRTLRRADATGSGRWDQTTDATGEVDQLMGVAYDREWITVLDADAMLRAADISATSDSNGKYALADLSSSTARLHRILGVYRNSVVHKPVPAREWLQAADHGLHARVWYRLGTSIQVLPVSASSAATFTVNSLPQAITGLAEAGAITTPSDAQAETFTEIVALEAAAMLLLKGATETNAAMVLKQQAQMLRTAMLSDLSRLAEGPLVMRYDDDPAEWGG